jgi:hypothetical protein
LIEAGPVQTTAKSAWGVTAVIKLEVRPLPLLFAGFGSGVLASARNVFVSMPSAGASKLMLKEIALPLARVAIMGQVTAAPAEVPPLDALKKVAVGGRLALTFTFVAVEGPRLVTVTV